MKKYFLFFIISLTIFLAHAIYTKHAIYGDGNGYYVTAQSLLYDHTFKSDKILNHLKNFPGRDYVFSRIFWDENKNPYSVGTSIFWIPSLALASLITGNPLDLIHELGPGITGIIFMLAGLYFLEKYLLNFYSAKAVLFTIISLYLGSNIFYYSSLEPALSHQPAFFFVAFLLYWTHNFHYSIRNLLILGGLFGLLHITRIADTLLLIPIILTLNLDLKKIVLMSLGFVLAISPQIAAQSYYYGAWTRNFYVTEASNQWSFKLIHLFEYLFSSSKGLFVWSPLYLLGALGLIKAHKYIVITTILAIWCLGSFWSAHSATTAGFGQRLSFAAVPYFALGIAFAYEKLKTYHQVILTVLFILWNFLLLYGFYVLKWKNLS